MKKNKYDKDAVMTILLITFVISTVITIFKVTSPFSVLCFLSGVAFAVLLASDMIE